jgi:predicted esterase YcpF (UPF0227 family)
VSSLKEILNEEVIAPTLTHRPKEDIHRLCRLMWDHKVTTVVGSSLGGFYALVLAQWFDVATVLINPSMRPYETTRRYLGTNKVFDSGAEFEWTEKDIFALWELSYTVDTALLPVFSNIAWHRVLLLLSENDEVLDSKDTMAKLPRAKVVLDPVQGHRFSDISMYAEAIRDVANTKPDIGEPDHFTV